MHITFSHLSGIFLFGFCGFGYEYGYWNGYSNYKGCGDGFKDGDGYVFGNTHGDGDLFFYYNFNEELIDMKLLFFEE